MKNVLIILFLFLLSVSCEFKRELDIELPASKAVLNGIIFADSAFKVNVSTSYVPSPAGAENLFINDAEISFFLNGEFEGILENMDRGGNYYMPGYIARQDDEIYLEVKTSDFEMLRSDTRIPERAEILSVDTAMYVVYNAASDRNDYGIKINMDIRINKKKKCYYLLALASWGEYERGKEDNIQMYNSGFTLSPTELLVHPETYFLGYYIYPLKMGYKGKDLNSNYFIFSNDVFEREEIQLSLDLSSIVLSYYDENLSFSKYYTLKLMSISPAFYLYLHSRLLQYQNNDFVFDSDTYISQPTFTNVQGGYGLFSSVCEDEYEFKLIAGDELPRDYYW